MNDAKIIKKIDELGRLVVPKHIRGALGVKIGESVELIADGNTLIIRKFNECCEFCGKAEELTEFKGKFICSDCKSEIKSD